VWRWKSWSMAQDLLTRCRGAGRAGTRRQPETALATGRGVVRARVRTMRVPRRAAVAGVTTVRRGMRARRMMAAVMMSGGLRNRRNQEQEGAGHREGNDNSLH